MNIFVKNHLELRLNKDGSIDEIIIEDKQGKCFFHLEQMDKHYFWARFYSTEEMPLEHDVILTIGAKIKDNQPVAFITHEDEPSDFPTPHPSAETRIAEYKLKHLIKMYGLDMIKDILEKMQ